MRKSSGRMDIPMKYSVDEDEARFVLRRKRLFEELRELDSQEESIHRARRGMRRQALIKRFGHPRRDTMSRPKGDKEQIDARDGVVITGTLPTDCWLLVYERLWPRDVG
jgi:hypothetical protein